MLRTPVDGRLQPGVGQVGADLLGDLTQVLLAQRGAGGHQLHDLVVDLGLQGGESQILQLPLDRVHAQPVGQRSEDLQGVSGDGHLLVLAQMTQGAHVVQPVGQLDHQDPDVAAHGQHHLADGLSLGRLSVRDLVQLGHAVDHGGDLWAEVGGELLDGVGGVLDGVVQQRGAQGGLVHAQLSQDGGHRQRVGDVGVPALAELACVVVLSGPVGPFDQSDVRLGMVDVNDPDQRIQHRSRLVALRTQPGQRLPHAGARLIGGQASPGLSRQPITLTVGTMDALRRHATLRALAVSYHSTRGVRCFTAWRTTTT